MSHVHGGALVGEILAAHGIQCVYTLCGGHISPILQGAQDHGLRIVDVRDERSAAFAADAASRMTGLPGVVAVTAGPGVTNTMTAVKNAQRSPSVIETDWEPRRSKTGIAARSTIPSTRAHGRIDAR